MTPDWGSQIEITPEPTPEERAAIVAALEVLWAQDPPPGPWWEAGLRESIDEGEGHGPCEFGGAKRRFGAGADA